MTKSYVSITIIIITYFQRISGSRKLLTEQEKTELCRELLCDDSVEQKVCGIRKQNGKTTYKLFDNECLLLKYGCQVDPDSAYGIIDMKYCNDHNLQKEDKANCPTNCSSEVKEPVCTIRKDGEGFRIRIFKNQCKLSIHNCKQDIKFFVTDFFICDSGASISPIKQNHSKDLLEKTTEKTFEKTNESNNTEINSSETNTEFTDELRDELKSNEKVNNSKERNNLETDATKFDDVKIYTLSDEKITEDVTVLPKTKFKKLIVVGGSINDLLNINKTAEDLFSATHVYGLPIREKNLSEQTRRRILNIFGPVKVFAPWIIKPKVIREDHFYVPTLSSCFHKCPLTCPDTYAPVCGMPGLRSREPSLIFQNHCYMDVAQCKMYWEDKSDTAYSSAYLEANFIFCLGDELGRLYRFLPVIRTLQHIGRLKKRGYFKRKLTNFKFFNSLLRHQPNIMG